MRHRYHPDADATVAKSPYVIHTVPITDSPYVVEVGCGKGQFLIAQARHHPTQRFLGIEQSAQALYRAVVLAEEHQLQNVWFLHGNVDDVLDALPKNISMMYLLFSDPWPKARHEKRRLTTLSRLMRYHEHGVQRLRVKTDNLEFYQYSLNQLTLSAFQVRFSGLAPVEEAFTTEFEDKYRNMGQPIYLMEATR